MFDICMKFLNILQQINLKPINENQILRQILKTTFCSREKTEQSVDVTRTHWKKRVRKTFFVGKASLQEEVYQNGNNNVIEELFFLA